MFDVAPGPEESLVCRLEHMEAAADLFVSGLSSERM